MRPHLLLRLAAVFVAVFALGHTLGMFRSPTRGLGEDAMMAAMQAYPFEVMGSQRTYFDFYRGYGWFVSASGFLLVAALWQVGGLVRQHGAAMRPLMLTLLLGCCAFTVLSAVFFFVAPAAACALASLAVGAALFARAEPVGAAATR